MTRTSKRQSSLGWRLFALSFAALFLELMVIRLVPAVVRLVAYYANLMLISSFLGLGIGAMLSARRWRVFRWFPLLLLVDLTFTFLCRMVVLPGSLAEMRFFVGNVHAYQYVALSGIFIFNSAVFVPLGEEMGRLFRALPTLMAYGRDLGGSLVGTLIFGVFSLGWFSPLLGMAAVMVLYLVLARRKVWHVAVFALTLAGLAAVQDPNAIWSPYYHITVSDLALHNTRGSMLTEEISVPPDVRTMRDPPMYAVRVNQDFYQQHGTLDLSRYTPGQPKATFIEGLRQLYLLGYQAYGKPGRVAVMGGGGGMDVEAALLSGAEHVDVVEIDPGLVKLARRISASDVYDDPRVTLHVNDVRAFLREAEPGFDYVVFGYLDSQALFSSMTNIRLDGFVYTVESMRSAFRLLSPNGVLVLAFDPSGKPWLAEKIVEMVRQATGITPVTYTQGEEIIVCAAKGTHPAPPPVIGPFHLSDATYTGVPLATDDWPFLYLAKRTIPSDYLAAIGVLLAVALGSLLLLRRRGFGAIDTHFLFLGWGFLLLETKSIQDCSLYFGTTWLVTMLVIAGILAMVMTANAWAARLTFSPWLYVPLLGTFLLLFLVPRETVLWFPLAGRLLWTLIMVPLPLFFAGLIFSTTFRDSPDPASCFGANLVGAMLGGFSEYLVMAVGNQTLSLLVVGVYLASLVAVRMARASKSSLAPAPT